MVHKTELSNQLICSTLCRQSPEFRIYSVRRTDPVQLFNQYSKVDSGNLFKDQY